MNVDWNKCPNSSLQILIEILCIVIDTWIVFSKAMGRCDHFRYVIVAFMATGLFLVANIEQHLPSTISDLVRHYNLSKDENSSLLSSLTLCLQVFQYTSYISLLLFANVILIWDSKLMLAIGLGGMSCCHFLIPIFQPYDIFIIICFYQGLFHGMIFPFFLTIVSFWTPMMENTTLISISMFGYWLGLAFWDTIFFKLTYVGVSFYVFGVLGLCWTLLWKLLGKDQPLNDPKITQTEMECILSKGNEGGITTLTKYIRERIFYTKSTLSIFVVILCNDFNSRIVSLTESKKMLDNTILYSYLIAAFVIVAIALISDCLRKNFNITIIKQIIICIGLLYSAIMIPFVGTYSVLFGSFIVVQAIILTSYLANLVDVMHHAAGYALGVYLGLTRSITFLVVFNLSNNSNVICWVVIALNVVGCLIYAICGSAKREIWAMKQVETWTETSIAVIKIRNYPATPSNV